MRVLLAQCAPIVGDVEKNLAKIESVFSKSDADLTIFPELFVSGYIPRDNLSALAEPIDGAIVSRLVDLCKNAGMALITGIPLTHPNITGQVTNSAVAIDKHGRVGRYDKSYLPTFGPFEESLYFAPGRSKLLMDIAGVKVGVVICYDLFFPELTRLLALQGAEMIVCISASPTATVINFKRIIPARAIENATYVVYSNLVGVHLNLVFGGESRAVDPRGELLAEARPLEEDLVYCDIDISKLEFARRMRPTLRDCRREIFEAILDLKKYE